MEEASSVALERSATATMSMLTVVREDPSATHVVVSAPERIEERRSAEDKASATRAAGAVRSDAT
jgi:hypothetical protein